ncbi:thioredoxin domain-containing protein [bacterium]|nr:thioredoxin domain-containing protein [bacterium]
MSDDNNNSDNDFPRNPPPSASPDDLRRHGNRLRDEASLYLRQHAHNPLDWYPWGPEALERARTENRPVFLSIGYSSCHWCHVMEHEVFEDDEVAAFMNAHFVSIKVDREERPDLDSVYMDAVQAMTGRGGWPMSVFLTPDLKPFHGGTYIPRDHFLQLVRQIDEVLRTRRADVERQADQVTDHIAAALPAGPAPADAALDASLIDRAVARAGEVYDAVNGGFQQQQKFPTPVKWRFLLHRHRRRNDPDTAARVAHTLEAMQGGGLQDHVGGGFHRYTVDHRWTVPHFEKMLYDNAQLAALYLEGGAALDRPDFTATGLDTLDFLMREMQDPAGGFYGSFDADSGGEEGTYYVWSPADLAAAVGEADAAILADVLGVDERGNFEGTGASVLTRRHDLGRIAARHGRNLEDVAALFPRHRTALRAFRDQRTPPGLDRKIITSWNGLTIAALVLGYAATGSTRYLDGARRAADHLLARHRRADGTLCRATSEGRAAGEGVLDDYAFLADGLVDLFQYGGDPRHLAAARELIDFARVDFARDDGPGYHLSGRRADAPLGRTVDYFDSVIPSGNAVMVRNLVRLAALTGESGYRDEAVAILSGWHDLLRRGGLELAGWLDAQLLVAGPCLDVVIAGDPDDDGTAALLRTYRKVMPAHAVLARVPAAGAPDDLLALAPALAGKAARDGRATAYVCEHGACRAPTPDPREFELQLRGAGGR